MDVAASRGARPGRGSRVLVVEDNESRLRTLMALLEDEGFDAIGCSTVTEGLQHVGQEDIAVAVVDSGPPASDGTELLKRFQEIGDNVPLVVLTPHASNELPNDTVTRGAYACVERGCDPHELVCHVRRAFQQHLENYADELEIAMAERTRELQETCEELGCEIDRRERTAEALVRSEALLATIVETAPTGIGLLQDRVFQWVNVPMLEMTGYCVADLLGKNVRILYETADEYERVGRVHYAQVRAEGVGEIDTQWRRKDATTLDVHLRSTPIDPKNLSAGVIITATDITERKQTEKTLQENEDKYRSIFEHSPELIVLVDARGTLLEANDRGIEWLGYEDRNFNGTHFSALPFWSNEDKARLGDLLSRRIAGEQVPPYEIDFIREDESTLACRVQGTIVRDAAGEVSHMLLMVSDVSKEKEAARALRAARDRAQRYLDIARVMFVALDEEGNITLVNQRACKILGYREGELIGKKWFETCLPETIRRHVNEVYRSLMAGEVDPAEYHENAVLTRNGNERLIAWRNTILRDKRGMIVGTLSSGEDITERRAIQDALKASEARLRLLVEQSPIGIVLCRPDGTVRYANPAARQIHRVSEEAHQYLLANYNILEDEQLDAKGLSQYIKRAFQGETVSLPVVRYDPQESAATRNLGDDVVWLDSSVYPVKDEDDRLQEVVVLHNDITDRKLAEDRLRDLEANLAHIGRVHTVGELAAALAHEINQPLYSIANYARGINRRIKKGAIDIGQLADVMGRVTHEVDRASGIVSHLRGFVRKEQPQRSTVDVTVLVDDVMKLLEANIRRNRTTVHLKLADDIPAVTADPIQIQQVVVNLIQNAMDAMSEVPDERRVLTIAARSTKDETVEIAVSDNGTGLPPDVADNIFDAFFTTKEEGLGIGLAISRTIVEAHGGRLWTVPNQPHGTTFSFTIPPLSGEAEDELEAHSIFGG